MIDGRKPNLSKIRIFGSWVQVKNSQKRDKNLDNISSDGLFMTYTGTDKIMYVVNQHGKKERTSAYVSFDEAHMTSTLQNKSPVSIAPQQAGHCQLPFTYKSSISSSLRIEPLNAQPTIPTKASPGYVGYYIYSSHDATHWYSYQYGNTSSALRAIKIT